MENFKDVFTRAEIRNWMKCHFAQSLAKDVLSDVVESEIESFRKQMVQNAQATPLQPPITVCNQCMTLNVVNCPTKTVCKKTQSGCKFHNGFGLRFRKCPTNGMCNRLCKEIIDNHRFNGPSWKNTDATQWCKVAWSIAKCYMPPDGYEKVNTAGETDFNGIVNIIINCIKFQKYFKDDLSKSANICTKARDKCRELRHSPTMTMTVDEMGCFIDTLVDILNDSVNVNNHSKFTETSQKLLQLKTDALWVTATDINRTFQDALFNLNTMAESFRDPTFKDIDSSKWQRMMNVADALLQLADFFRIRMEHANFEENMRLSNETFATPVGDVTSLTGSVIQTSDAGAWRSTIGDIAAGAFALGCVLAFGPVVPITLASIYYFPTIRRVFSTPEMPYDNDLRKIKYFQQATMALREELEQLFDQRHLKSSGKISIDDNTV